MTIADLIKILSEHHPSKEVFLLVPSNVLPYELTSVEDEHDSVYLLGQ